MSTLFISHSSQDNEIAKEVSERLAAQNHHSVFLDLDPEKGIVAGQSWERTLYRKLRACRAVIVLCTDNYLTSHWCFAEIALARMEGKHIIALQVDPLSPDAKLPSILTEKQFIDLRKKKKDKKKQEEGYQRLWHGLKEMDLLGASNEWDPKQSPYLGLSAYQEQHAPVFFGRDDETRVGLELLDRGAPGLVMVLGASGSGKSSLVRAGMVPRLRKDKDRWLVVGPFRPRRNPFAELAESLTEAFETYAPDEAGSEETRQRIRALRGAGLGSNSVLGAESAAEDGEQVQGSASDQRLPRLLQQLEELRQRPPEVGGSPWLEFLDWNLDDLRQICGEAPREQAAVAPQADALVEIADQLRRASGHRESRVLLVIDQFEELLGHEDTADDANRFLDLLRTALETEHSPLMVLGTMRSDFLGLFQRNRALLGIDFESLSVGPMSVDGMRRVIEEPAKLGAIELERGLADSLLEDTETPDALPLLSFTLSVLWKGRQNGTLTVRQYTELDGLHGAVAREAEAVLDLARKQGKEDDVRKAFLQMARLTEDGSYARLPVNWDRDEIRQVQPILEDFEKRRLLVTRMEEGEQRTVEVAHEALFRSWTPLKTWLDDHRGELLLEAQLRRDARAWEENDHAKDNLWRGGRLQQAAELMRKGELGGGGTDRTQEERFVRAAVRRRRIQLGTLAGITFSVIAVLSVFLIYALNQRTIAEENEQKAKEQEQIAIKQATEAKLREQAALVRNLLPAKPLEGLLLAIQTTGQSQSKLGCVLPGVQSSLLSAIQIARESNRFSEHAAWTNSVAISPDHRTIVVGGRDDANVRTLDLEGHSVSKSLQGHDGNVTTVAISPDGTKIVSGSRDKTVRLWDLEGNSIGEPLTGHEDAVTAVAISPDGTKIVSGSRDKTVRLWDLEGNPIGKPLSGHEHWVTSVAMSPDGTKIVSGSRDKTVRLWDLEGNSIGEPLTGHDDAVSSVAVSPDGKTIVSGSYDKTVRLWDLEGNPIRKPLRGHDERVSSVTISPDGRIIVSGSNDGTVRLWDLKGNRIGEPLRGHDVYVTSVAISLDGKTVVSAGSHDDNVRLWDLGKNPIRLLAGYEGRVSSAAISPDGKTIVTGGGDDGTVRLWDLEGNPVGEPVEGHQRTVTSVAWSPDGKHIVSGSEDMTVRLWDRKGNPIGDPFRGHSSSVYSVSFSPDGKYIVSGGGDDVSGIGDTDVRLWNLEGKPIGDPFDGHKAVVRSVAFSPDGQFIVSGSEENTVRLSNVEGKPVGEPFKGHQHKVFSVAFSPDGQAIVSGSIDKTVRLWDRSGKPIGDPFKGHTSGVYAVAFSSDGQYVASGSQDGTVRFSDLGGNPVGSPFKRHSDVVSSVVFSPDGQTLISGSWDGTIGLWRAGDWRTWLRAGCERLRGHPVLVDPDSKMAEEVGEICLKYGGWTEAEKARFLVKKGRALAKNGHLTSSLAHLTRARELDSGIDIPTVAEVKQLAASAKPK